MWDDVDEELAVGSPLSETDGIAEMEIAESEF